MGLAVSSFQAEADLNFESRGFFEHCQELMGKIPDIPVVCNSFTGVQERISNHGENVTSHGTSSENFKANEVFSPDRSFQTYDSNRSGDLNLRNK